MQPTRRLLTLLSIGLAIASGIGRPSRWPGGQDGPRARGPDPGGHGRRPAQGGEGVQGRAALHRAPRGAGVVGQPGDRPERPADRLRPVRQALPDHPAPGRRARRRRSRSSRSPSRSARPRGCSGRSIASMSMVNAGRQVQERPLPGQDTDGDDQLDKVEMLRELERQRRARPARDRPRPRRQVALCRRRQRDEAPRALRLARAEGLGRGQPALPDDRRQRLHARREGPRRLHLPGRPRRQELGTRLDGLCGTPTTSPSTRTGNCSPTTPTWSGT